MIFKRSNSIENIIHKNKRYVDIRVRKCRRFMDFYLERYSMETFMFLVVDYTGRFNFTEIRFIAENRLDRYYFHKTFCDELFNHFLKRVDYDNKKKC